MGTTSFRFVLLTIGTAVACSNPPPTDTGQALQGTWASAEARLTVTDSDATLQLLASGGCFGSYGQITRPIPSGHFSVPGTYTQLIGAYPGKLEYPARYSGMVDGTDLTLTIAIATLPLSIGPLDLTAGVIQSWPPCHYP